MFNLQNTPYNLLSVLEIHKEQEKTFKISQFTFLVIAKTSSRMFEINLDFRKTFY